MSKITEDNLPSGIQTLYNERYPYYINKEDIEKNGYVFMPEDFDDSGGARGSIWDKNTNLKIAHDAYYRDYGNKGVKVIGRKSNPYHPISFESAVDAIEKPINFAVQTPLNIMDFATNPSTYSGAIEGITKNAVGLLSGQPHDYVQDWKNFIDSYGESSSWHPVGWTAEKTFQTVDPVLWYGAYQTGNFGDIWSNQNPRTGSKRDWFISAQAAPLMMKGVKAGGVKAADQYASDVTKRAMNVAMHTTAAADPLYEIKLGAGNIFPKTYKFYNKLKNSKLIPKSIKQKLPDWEKGGDWVKSYSFISKEDLTSRRRKIRKYILTGKKDLHLGLEFGNGNGTDIYTGFFEKLGKKDEHKSNNYTDAIDAYLGEGEIDPFYGVEKLPYSLINLFPEKWRQKYGDADTYWSSNKDRSFLSDDNVYDITETATSGSMTTNTDMLFNSAGHRLRTGFIDKNHPYYNLFYERLSDAAKLMVDREGRMKVKYEMDLWKFDPESYSKKWFIRGPLARWGLKKVDEAGHPFVTVSGWSPVYH